MSLSQLAGQRAALEIQLKACALSDPRRPQLLADYQRVSLALRSVTESIRGIGGINL
ncbi:hypothetical protein Q5H92_22960 [Hymenobacter sp. M29]|uniref:EscE/YscE/SsaE family type III secretion system needle protein co-chaperone n=1 Tax=Hymenobacter mellowenesis TaxID=3063995 RepID=A0ABT9AI50_9BACT|nr:hypothetical protein [Hymenobacter sp. M29]MDO7849243.1 hypothetical protein [Hymenobacter sp. M29]